MVTQDETTPRFNFVFSSPADIDRAPTAALACLFCTTRNDNRC